MTTLELLAPVAGWALPLAAVPDPVFAGGLAGDGVAIDPTGELLHAPCDGVVAMIARGRHALTLKCAAGEVLMHLGIDTVKLGGSGFRLLVRDGEQVSCGQRLLEFDLEAIVRQAPSAVTPVLLAGAGAGRILARVVDQRVAVGDRLLSVVAAAGAATAAVAATALTQSFRVPFDHGLHARPAARVVAALAAFEAEVTLRARGRSGNARSTVALMALGVDRGEIVEVNASGADAAAALAALGALLERIETAAKPPPATLPPAPPPRSGAELGAVIAARGLASGVAVRLQAAEVVVAAASGDAASESRRLRAALAAVVAHLEALAGRVEGLRRGVLDAHLALAQDPQLLREAEAALGRGASAGAAWREALSGAAQALARLDDPRMAERRADLKDIERQVLAVLAGAKPGGAVSLPAAAVVLADELLPSQLLALEPGRLAGICMAAGGPTSHVAILAASQGIPTLVAAGAAVLAIADGTPLIVDAERGRLLVDPPPAARARLTALIADRAATRRADTAAAARPATLADGTGIHVYCNLGAAAEAVPALAQGAEGCGLLRTEFLFLERETAPTAAEQLAQYQAIATALAGRTLTIRTLDAGGDKPLPFLPMPREENPALGLRGLRTSLYHPELLATQLRAIVAVEPAGQCRVLLPMVTDLADVRSARACLTEAARALGRPAPKLGIMVETPSSALLAPQLAAEVDFISIGSNDLAQYTLAIDRLHPALAARLDGLHPAVLQLIAACARAGNARQLEVGVCGGLASDPEAVPLLVGLGVRELSVVPAMIPEIKGLLRRLALADCERLASTALAQESAAAVRAAVQDWLTHGAGAPRPE